MPPTVQKADSELALDAMGIAQSLASVGANCPGTFANCPVEVNSAFMEKVSKKDSPPPWIGDAPAAVGHPDNTDIERLKEAIETRLSGFIY